MSAGGADSVTSLHVDLTGETDGLIDQYINRLIESIDQWQKPKSVF